MQVSDIPWDEVTRLAKALVDKGAFADAMDDDLAREAGKAMDDASASGFGFVRFNDDGTCERLPPSRVLYMPDDPEIPE